MAGKLTPVDSLREGDIATIYWLDHCGVSAGPNAEPELFMLVETREIRSVLDDRVVAVGCRPRRGDPDWRYEIYIKSAITEVIVWGNINDRVIRPSDGETT